MGIHDKGRMQFYRDILMGHHRGKNKKRLNYSIEEWHTYTQYDILRNHSTYPTVCLLLETWHRTDRCISVCGKLIFDSNLKLALPLTQFCLNYICFGNENKFISDLHAIRSVLPEVVQRRLAMKQEL